MKFINSLGGIVGLHISAEEVLPVGSLPIRDLIRFLGETYQFVTRPQFPPEGLLTSMEQFVFQHGVMTKEDKKYVILQLVLLPNGDIITAATTEIADIIMDDFTRKLDEHFEYRFATANKRCSYASNIVVDFDFGIEEKIDVFRKIESLLNRRIPRPEMPFKIKRVAFGYGNPTVPTFSLEEMERADFVIERRANEPYERNRYYSAAPMATSAHIKLLEAIEREFG